MHAPGHWGWPGGSSKPVAA
ncbi:YXWGXW repeat-containing protein [Mitsuaria sp. WAJ17]|nr:YXWGXW repeat-containing protein [Mitsuaria sp. WAJ17]